MGLCLYHVSSNLIESVLIFYLFNLHGVFLFLIGSHACVYISLSHVRFLLLPALDDNSDNRFYEQPVAVSSLLLMSIAPFIQIHFHCYFASFLPVLFYSSLFSLTLVGRMKGAMELYYRQRDKEAQAAPVTVSLLCETQRKM